MPVTAVEIVELRRDEAICLALTRATGEPQTMRSVIGRLAVAALESLQNTAGPDECSAEPMPWALGLGPYDIVGDRADAMVGLLEQLVPILCEASRHHARNWKATRKELGLQAADRDRVLSRYGSRLGHIAVKPGAASGISAAYRAAGRAALAPSGPTAADKRAVGVKFENRPDLQSLWQEACEFATGTGRFHHLLNTVVGSHSPDFPACRCDAQSIEMSMSCRRHEAVSGAVAGFLDKTQRQLAALFLSGESGKVDDAEKWFWNLAEYAMRDAVARSRPSGEQPLSGGDDQGGYAPLSADEVFESFRRSAIEALAPGHGLARAWFSGPAVIDLLSQWDGAPRKRTREGVRRAVRKQFLSDTGKGRAGLGQEAEAAADAFLRAIAGEAEEKSA